MFCNDISKEINDIMDSLKEEIDILSKHISKEIEEEKDSVKLLSMYTRVSELSKSSIENIVRIKKDDSK